MNSAPDRRKECLPPKKREFQAPKQRVSAEEPSKDSFKQPSPQWRKRTEPQAKDPAHCSSTSLLTLKYPTYNLTAPQWLTSVPAAQQDPVLWGSHYARTADPSAAYNSFLHPGAPPLTSRWKHDPNQQSAHRAPSEYQPGYGVDPRELWPHLSAGKQSFSPSLPLPSTQPRQQPPSPRDPLHGHRKHLTTEATNGFDGTALGPGNPFSQYHFKGRAPENYPNGKRKCPGDQRLLDTASSKHSRPSKAANSHSADYRKDQRLFSQSHSHAQATVESRRAKHAALDEVSPVRSTGWAQIFYGLPASSTYMGIQRPPLGYSIYSHLDPAQGPAIPFYSQQGESGLTLRTSGLLSVSNRIVPPGVPLTVGGSGSDSQHPSPGIPIDYSIHSPAGHPSHTEAGTTVSASSPSPSPAPKPPLVLPHFAKGSLIQLSTGELRRVEDMHTEDFMCSADASPELRLSYCTVQRIRESPDPGFTQLQVLLSDHTTQVCVL
ncbi:ataxin-1-like [Polyodon spathula]|uniref:ataxin-1-like n=1 Tax=Polyodon spathula TaxID=7913 RepID=UPI001B7EEF50|nr:ataxin-1-like [Polyodon spathula]